MLQMEKTETHEWVIDETTNETTCIKCGAYKYECPLGVDYTDHKKQVI